MKSPALCRRCSFGNERRGIKQSVQYFVFDGQVLKIVVKYAIKWSFVCKPERRKNTWKTGSRYEMIWKL